MKKLIALTLMAAMAVMTFGPALSVATPIITSLDKDTTGGFTPIVKAKWEANGADTYGVVYASALEYYRDDSTAAGAQFLPSGIKDVSKTIAICAVVTDPDGLADIDHVYADVFYPENVALGEHHTPLTDQSGLGCGELMQEDTLARLSKDDGIQLFCGNVQTLNNNLPTFESGYDYAEICAADGELQKETAAVYCATKDLSYEDPFGVYKVWAVAQDTNGQQGILENSFEYKPVTAFETDFASIAYGSVRLNIKKIISGNLTWGDALASVRNVGNTRLAMRVSQDDMGLGKTDGNWNVKYDGRVGSDVAFKNYWPEQTMTLNGELDLSEMDEMDFSVTVSKFPPTGGCAFTGNMNLSAIQKAHLTCSP